MENPSVIVAEFFCERHARRMETPNLVCLQKNCPELGLLCRICCSENHSRHDTISYTKLTDMYNGFHFKTQRPVEKASQLLKQLRVLHHSSLQEVRNMVWSILAQLEGTIQWLELRFSDTEKAIEGVWRQLSENRMNPIDLRGLHTDSMRTLNEKVEKMVRIVRRGQRSFEEAERKTRELYQMAETSSNTMIKTISQLTSNFHSVLSNDVKELWEAVSTTNIQKQFGKGHSDLERDGVQVVRTNESTVQFSTLYSACAMGAMALDVTQASKYICRLRIDRLMDYLDVGLVEAKGMQQGIFHEISLRQMEIPHYLFCSSGKAKWKGGISSERDSIKFNEGDQIELEFSTPNMTLSAKKLDEDRCHRISVGTLQGDCVYRWAVFLHRKGDAVSLIVPNSSK